MIACGKEAVSRPDALGKVGKVGNQIEARLKAKVSITDRAHWLWVMDEVDRMRAEDPNYVGFYPPRTYCEWEDH